MIEQGSNAVIVNTGSKQGITMPPGDTAYNVSKSGVKTLTEGLQHTLRETPGCKVNAFLLVPGWTITMIGESTVGHSSTIAELAVSRPVSSILRLCMWLRPECVCVFADVS